MTETAVPDADNTALLQQVLDENEQLKKTSDRALQSVEALKSMNDRLQQEVLCSSCDCLS